MKKYSILAIAFAAMAFAACQNEIAEVQTPAGALRLSMEPVSKATVSDQGAFAWSSTDKVAIITDAGVKTFSYVSGEGTSTATFDGDLTGVTSASAVIFPASDAVDASTVNLPSEYNYTEGEVMTPLYAANPSLTEVNQLKHLCGALKVVISNIPAQAAKFVFTAPNKISGDFAIDFSGDVPVIKTEAAASASVTVNFTAGSATEMSFYIPLPIGTYNSFSAELQDSEGKVLAPSVKSSKVANSVSRKSLVIMPGYEVTYGLKTAADLKAFAAAVNSGDQEMVALYDTDGDGIYVLENDIDFGGEEIEPIGKGDYGNANTVNGTPFTGVFDGGNHTIDNFKITLLKADNTTAACIGFFGIVQNGLIKNLKVGDKAEILVEGGTNMSRLGSIAGYLFNSSIENCESSASVSFTAGTNDKRNIGGGIIGMALTNNDEDLTIKNCVFRGNVTAENNGINSKNGAGGLHAAGIAGFTDYAAGTTGYVRVLDCTNYGTISGQATRMSGIVASLNNNTYMENCVNYGSVTDTDITATNSRPAGIASAMAGNCTLKDCVNYGDVTFAVDETSIESSAKCHGFAAGICGQLNQPTALIDGCKNYGTIRSDSFRFESAHWIGSIFVHANSTAANIKNCDAAGKIGPYTVDDTYKVITLTSANFSDYLHGVTGDAKNGKVVLTDNYCSVSAE